MPDAPALLDTFRSALERAGGRLVVAPDRDAARRIAMDLASGGSVAWGPDDPGEAALRDAEVGVDEADGLIAETGTVVRTFPSRERARVSLVPPVAVFLATPETLVATVGDALARVANRHEEGRAVTAFVTGPSRTADIEKRLVIPAHGPRELVVVWLGGDPDA